MSDTTDMDASRPTPRRSWIPTTRRRRTGDAEHRGRRGARAARASDRRGRPAARPALRDRRHGRALAGARGRVPDDDHQHGSPAPVHARGVADHDGARRRGGRARQAGDRVSAHRHGEDRRAAHVRAGRHQRHPDGLRVTDRQRAGVLDGGGAAARHRGARAGGVGEDAARRAEPHGVAPAVPGVERHGPRRGLDDALRLARARGDAASARDDHGPADEPQLRPAGGHRRRSARRLATRGTGPLRPRRARHRRVRRAAERQPDLARAHRRRRHRSPPSRRSRSARRARSCAPPGSRGTCARRSRTSPTTRSTST